MTNINNKLNIVFLDADTLGTDVSLDPISANGNLVIYPNTQPSQIVERAKDCDVLIVNKIKIGKEQIDALPNLKLICEAATGVDNIDVAYATSKGISVKNAKGYSTESVVQVNFTILLALLGNIEYFDNFVKSGDYTTSNCFTNVQRVFWELKGKKYGIIGLGNIGTKVAHIAQAFGMEVIYYPTSGKAHSNEFKAVSLDELMSNCDVISIHAPMNDNTRNLITYDKLKLMKKSAYIINLGRGGIINESDLVQALNDNCLAGAGIDVFTAEPLPADSPYFAIKDKSKILLTPHIGWCSREARESLISMVADNIKSIL